MKKESNLNCSPVDVIITWVDDQDEKWKAERKKYMGEFPEKKEHLNHYFRDWDTLKYVLRGIEKNMPWVRYVHFVTCGHVPEWLNLSCPRLRFHRHKDFFSEETALPTFSSRPIEMNLMNIPDLAERIVYFNDDMLVTGAVTEDRFFKNGLPIDYLVLDIPRGGWLYDRIRIKDPFAQAVKNAIISINRIYPLKKLYSESPEFFFEESYPAIDKFRNRMMHLIGKYKWIKVHHNPQALLLSNMRKCESLFADQIKETRRHRFRQYTDFNQYIFRFLPLMSGKFYPHYFADDFCVVLSSVKSYEKTRHYLWEKKFVCLNDSPFLSEDEYPELRRLVVRDMETLFPDKSQFEK